jgi:hypothetical protein
MAAVGSAVDKYGLGKALEAYNIVHKGLAARSEVESRELQERCQEIDVYQGKWTRRETQEIGEIESVYSRLDKAQARASDLCKALQQGVAFLSQRRVPIFVTPLNTEIIDRELQNLRLLSEKAHNTYVYMQKQIPKAKIEGEKVRAILTSTSSSPLKETVKAPLPASQAAASAAASEPTVDPYGLSQALVAYNVVYQGLRHRFAAEYPDLDKACGDVAIWQSRVLRQAEELVGPVQTKPIEESKKQMIRNSIADAYERLTTTKRHADDFYRDLQKGVTFLSALPIPIFTPSKPPQTKELLSYLEDCSNKVQIISKTMEEGLAKLQLSIHQLEQVLNPNTTEEPDWVDVQALLNSDWIDAEPTTKVRPSQLLAAAIGEETQSSLPFSSTTQAAAALTAQVAALSVSSAAPPSQLTAETVEEAKHAPREPAAAVTTQVAASPVAAATSSAKPASGAKAVKKKQKKKNKQ